MRSREDSALTMNVAMFVMRAEGRIRCRYLPDKEMVAVVEGKIQMTVDKLSGIFVGESLSSRGLHGISRWHQLTAYLYTEHSCWMS
jgi:hypothetical protein